MPEKPKSLNRSEKFSIVPKLFDYIFVLLRQKARLRPELSPKFLSILGPNSNRTRKARPDLQLWYDEMKRAKQTMINQAVKTEH